jgi:hypothetical protein
MPQERTIALPRWLVPMNRVFVALQRVRLGPTWMHTLIVPGRRSGKPRSTPVTPMIHDGERYIIGGFPGADWVANARVAGEGILASHRGRRRERVGLVELPVDEARPVLRAFAQKVPTGVSMMVNAGVAENDTPEAFAALAGRCAVFRIAPLE